MSNKVALVILDGYGIGKDYKYNAVTHANSPFLHSIFESSRISQLEASQQAVGLPAGTMGGSEVGHYTIGAGRIVNQALHRINQEIKNGEFQKNTTLLNNLKESEDIHLIGMISDAGVHSHIDHLNAILEVVSVSSPGKKCFLHAISDGRDVEPKSLKRYIEHIQVLEKKHPQFKLATCIGRYYAMDRDKNIERTQIAFDNIYNSIQTPSEDIIDAINSQYTSGIESDYYLKPIATNNYQAPTPEDLVLFFNFRTDRAAQLSEMIVKKNKLIIFGDYCKQATNLFENPMIKNHLGEILSKNNIPQLRVAETEKYAHVTYFFNTQVKTPYPLEDRQIVESKKVANYKQAPEMSAKLITQTVIDLQKDKDYKFILVNYANPDLVGHSGSFEATIQAIECIDKQLEILCGHLLNHGYDIMVTSDHGNSEQMATNSGEPLPSHTTNPVPFTIISKQDYKLRATGELQDVAPTILEILNISQPAEMTGKSIIIN